MATVLLKAVEGLELDIARGGFLQSGRKVYYQAELTPETIGNSGVKRYVTTMGGHDGAVSVGFGSSNTVIVCKNTFHRAYFDVQHFQHSLNLKKNIEQAQAEFRKTIGLDNKLMESFKRMADEHLREDAIELTVSKLFGLKGNQKVSDLTKRTQTRIIKFRDSVETSIEEQGMTVWALFNGITRYANHVAAPEDIVKKMDYLMLNGGRRFMNDGYNLLNNYIKELPKQEVFLMS